ncbi:AI-2E family transporter [Nodularia sp. UHCC 0506]|uniref:AI-2E family transporter n=1 Tax=Nodularia sp. UHCC 0506 TaxID=3110243 RepID=UPI002B20E431|nr:AI-2E family transporter [Nodularia sp. UHCC 0506]MEA5516240.1 AI-2E family transporter [Nodularia sp. UHCC 0506]
MSISLKELLKWLILTLLFPLVFLNFWLIFLFLSSFQSLVTIFILATLLAFVLNYPVTFFQQVGVKRNYAIALVLISALVIFAVVGLILLPIVLPQLNEMAKLLPEWIDGSEEKIKLLDNWAISHELKINFSQIISNFIERLPDELENLTDKLFSIVIETIDSVSDILITIVLTFYILLDGPRIWAGIFKKLPWSFTEKVQRSLQQNFQNYLIGQVTLASLMGFLLTVIFLVFQVQFGLIFGLGVGIFSLIPFGDVASISLITLIIASHNFWLAVKILAVAVVTDQFIDQAIAPRLLGRFTGLRPIWVLVALLLGTYIGGLLGLLIAVPIAGFIKDALDGFSQSDDRDGAVTDAEIPEILNQEPTS